MEAHLEGVLAQRDTWVAAQCSIDRAMRAIGNRSTPGRIWKNMGMPGHMGDKRVTVQNLKVVQVRQEEGVILIAGAIPGANGGYVVVRPAKKAQSEAAK